MFYCGSIYSSIAIGCAYSTGTPRALLPAGMTELLRIANNGGHASEVTKTAAEVLCSLDSESFFKGGPSSNPHAAPFSIPSSTAASTANGTASSADGVWPRVHALNSLRMAFLDRTLAIDCSGFFADGIQAAISALAAQHWEIRNAASMCFVALMTRVLGFMNVQSKLACAKRMPTGAEFFIR